MELAKDTFSINYGTNKELISFDSERDFHGDGFSIEVYQLDKQSQDYYKSPPLDFFSIYPKRNYHSSKFEVFKWTRTPQRPEDTYKKNINLGFSPMTRKKKLESISC